LAFHSGGSWFVGEHCDNLEMRLGSSARREDTLMGTMLRLIMIMFRGIYLFLIPSIETTTAILLRVHWRQSFVLLAASTERYVA